ncbi:hypothetical protein Tco_0504732 [Tanacetum coccineum]
MSARGAKGYIGIVLWGILSCLLHPQSPTHLSTLIPSQGESSRELMRSCLMEVLNESSYIGEYGTPHAPGTLRDQPQPADEPHLPPSSLVMMAYSDLDETEDDDEEEEDHLAQARPSAVTSYVDLVPPTAGGGGGGIRVLRRMSPAPTLYQSPNCTQLDVLLDPRHTILLPSEAKVERLLALPIPPTISTITLIDHREDTPVAELPSRNRLCLTTPTLRNKVGESSTAAPRPTRGHRADYGFYQAHGVPRQTSESRGAALGQIQALQARDQTHADDPEGVGSSA